MSIADGNYKDVPTPRLKFFLTMGKENIHRFSGKGQSFEDFLMILERIERELNSRGVVS